MTSSTDSFTNLLADARLGKREALDRILPIVYDELHRLATVYLRRERPGHTLQPTALVNEAYLRLVDQARLEAEGRTHFLAIAANVMRQVLVDHARARDAGKRGGGLARVTLDDGLVLPFERDFDLLWLDEALGRLGALDPRMAQVVELRFFAGLTTRETADVLGLSTATVEREWATARGWLRRELLHGTTT